MKTTVELPDALVREARRVALREGTTVRALIERGLRSVVTGRRPRGAVHAAQGRVPRRRPRGRPAAARLGDARRPELHGARGVIAVDTNILVYAHREESEWYEPAERAGGALAEGAAGWAIPWPCVHEFLAITTHPRIFLFRTPTPLRAAPDQASRPGSSRRRSSCSPRTPPTGHAANAAGAGPASMARVYTTHASRRCASVSPCGNSGRPTATSRPFPPSVSGIR